MKSNIVSISDLEKCGRWRVEIFLTNESDTLESKWPMVTIASICEDSAEANEPPRTGNRFTYVGLENVEPVTGDLVGDTSKEVGQVKSRSKVFKKGDVLYGRLRPNLRKVLAATDIEGGLCSTEFIVLRPTSDISPAVLRAIVASRWVSSQLEKLQIGAALPRVSSRDLLAVKVPLPDKPTQKKLETLLKKLAEDRMAAKAIIAKAPEAFEKAIASAIS